MNQLRPSQILTGASRPTGEMPEDVFRFLASGLNAGLRGAFVTLVGIEGSVARSLGAQMGVLEDGRYCGFISGGCAESAVAVEAVAAIEQDRDTTLRLGKGSPFFDIQLPCGSSLDLRVDQVRDPMTLRAGLEGFANRQPFSLALGNAAPAIGDAIAATGWRDGRFHRGYEPPTRLVLAGRGIEMEAMATLALASGLEVQAYCSDDHSAMIAAEAGARVVRLTTPAHAPILPTDPWTAVVLLLHDNEWEVAMLPPVLAGDPFFIGALGSRATHARRLEALAEAGVAESDLRRIRGPVGLFGPCRDAASLAVSILAEIYQSRTERTP